MSEISVVVVGSTSVNSVVGNGDTVNVNVGNQTVGGGNGAAATIEAGTVTTIDATQTATVTNVGTAYAAKFNFSLPRGSTGAAGPANSLSIGTVSTGTTAAVSISGTSPSQTLSFVLQPGPTGPANSLSIGSVSTGTTAAVSITGTAPSQSLSFVLPQGPTGPANSLSIGSVSTGATAAVSISGSAPSQQLSFVLQPGPTGPANSLSIGSVSTGATAAVSISGSAPSQQLSFVLQPGPTGPANSLSIGSVTTGTTAAVSISGSAPSQSLSFVLPVGPKGDTGAQGPSGPSGSVNLADETPQPLGTASAGTALTAARADHVHAVGSVQYSSLSGIPSSFTPSAHSHAVSDVTGLQAVLDSKQAAGNYAPLVNNLVPSANLPSFVDDVVDVGGTLPASGEVGKIYVVSTGANTNKIYRWSGSSFIEISPSPGSTDSVAEGSTNLYHTTVRAAAAAPVQSVAGRTGTVTLAQLGSSGTASSSTFLRGDGAWSAAGSTDAGDLTTGTLAAARLPLATTTAAGAVIVGSGLSIANGVLSRSSSYDPAAAPGAPSGIAFNTSTGGLTWNASPGGVATQYEVQRSAMGAGAWTTVATVSGLSFSITAISWSNIDKFRVRGLNADSLPGEWGYQEGATPGGGGGSANIVEAATAAGFPATGASGTLYHATDVRRIYFWDASGGVYVEAGTSGGGSAGGSGEDTTLRSLFIPAAPTSVTASAGNAQATVSWTAPAALSVLPITDYTIQFQPSGGSWTTFTRAASTATSATVTGLTNGTAYTFKVSATNGLGAGSYSSASSAVTPAAAAAIAYANKYGPGSYSVTGTGTVTASVTGGNNADTRLWLLIGTSGTLSYTVTASSENGYDGGALYRTSSANIQPANHSTGLAYNSNPPGLVVVSDIVSGTGTSTGTVSVTAGQHLVLRYAKDDGGDAGTDSITAVLSIS